MFLTPKEDQSELIARFETLLKDGTPAFFDSSSWEDIIDYYLRNIQYEKAAIAASMALDTYPASSELGLICAEAFIYDGNPERARTLLDTLKDLCEDDPDYLVAQGLYHSSIKETKQAIEYYLAAYSRYDDPLRLDLLLGEEYAAAGNLSLAAKYLQKAVLAHPEDADAIARLSEVYSYGQNDAQAVRFFNRLIDADPYNADAWHNLGIFLAKEEKWDEALRAYRYTLLLDPERAIAYYDMAEVYDQREEYAKTIETLKSLLALRHLDDPYPYLRLGESYQALEDFDNACEYFLKAVHYDPQLARGWYGLAAVHFDAGYKKQALDYIRQGIDADNSDIECLRLLWEIEESLQMYPQALEHLEQVIDHPESNAEDYLDLAYFLYQRGRTEQALETLKTTRTLFPDAHEVFYHLCAVYCALGRRERCLEMFERAVRLAPDMIGVLRDNYPELMRVDETNKKIYLT